jgi:hypothetical protein
MWTLVAAHPGPWHDGEMAERYARGEIDADEYQVRLALLREGRQRP